MCFFTEFDDECSRVGIVERIRIAVGIEHEHISCSEVALILLHEKSARENRFKSEVDPTITCRTYETLSGKCRIGW